MTQDVEEVVAIKRRHERSLLSQPNVVGVDVGFKYVNGERTDEIAIRVFVRQKQNVSAADAVPEWIEGVKTDVIEEGEVTLRVLEVPANQVVTTVLPLENPLIGGVSIGTCPASDGSTMAGTLGGIVQDPSGTRYSLSNAHVLCLDTPCGGSITQPAVLDGGTCPGTVIGTVAKRSFPVPGISMDAAISTNSRPTSTRIKKIGRVAGTVAPSLGAAVRKHGRTTKLTYGTIDGVDRTVNVSYRLLGSVEMHGLIAIADTTKNSSFSDEGDSGSFIVDAQNNVTGLLVAGTDTSTFAIEFRNVEIELEVKLSVSQARATLGKQAAVVYRNDLHVCFMEESGYLWDYYYTDGWNLQQLTGTGGLTNGPAMLGTAAAVVFGADMHVCYADGAGNLWDTYYHDGGWNLQQFTGSGGLVIGPPAVGPLAAVVFNSDLHVCFTDLNGSIKDVYYHGNTWCIQTLNGSDGVTSGPAAAGALGAIVFNSDMHVCYTDGSGTIWDSYYHDGGWLLQQLTGSGGLTSGPAAARELTAVVFASDMHVCYPDQNGTIWDAYYHDGGWNLQQLTGSGGLTTGTAAAGPLSAVIFNSDMHVCYTDAGGNIWDVYYHDSAWNLQQLTGSGGLTAGPAAAGQLAAAIFGNEMHVFYESTSNGSPWHVYWSSGSWNALELA